MSTHVSMALGNLTNSEQQRVDLLATPLNEIANAGHRRGSWERAIRGDVEVLQFIVENRPLLFLSRSDLSKLSDDVLLAKARESVALLAKS